MNLKEMIEKSIEVKASDVHICAYTTPKMRVDGSLKQIAETSVLSPEDAKNLCFSVLTPEQQAKCEKDKEIDFSFSIGQTARVRANIFQQHGTVAGAFRNIPYIIPTIEQLGLPEAVVKLTQKPRGLVLVTGPTGCGKSTTLAAMIDRINQTQNMHIITVEDPIEYIYEHKKCIVNQRQVGHDTETFARGLKYILRQDPDVVLIGEMRDLETVQAAITTAETGHIVLATLHTNTAVQTIDRIIDVFPPYQQPQIRAELAIIIEGVLCQQLIPRIGGGRALALEIMMPTAGIRNLIREAKTHQIYSQMQVGQDITGMQTLNQSLLHLVKSEMITYEAGLSHCTDVDEFKAMAGKGPVTAKARR